MFGSPASPSFFRAFPAGTIAIDPAAREITGSTPERQDALIAPRSAPAARFRAYFCARLSARPRAWGVVQNGTVRAGARAGDGGALAAYVRFGEDVRVVEVRVGVSFISVEQARRNLDAEAPDGTGLEETARRTRAAWKEKLDRIVVEGASEAEKEVFYTAFYHTLQACLS